MDPATLFRICNLAVLPGWAMLILLPRWRLTRELIPAVILPLLLAIVYLFLVVAYFGAAKGGFGSLDGVAALFQYPHVLLAGWIHYLAFDLFIGSWESPRFTGPRDSPSASDSMPAVDVHVRSGRSSALFHHSSRDAPAT